MPLVRVAGGVQAGSFSAADAGIPTLGEMSNANPKKLVDFSKPSTWSIIYFLLALGLIFGMYFGHGGSLGFVI